MSYFVKIMGVSWLNEECNFHNFYGKKELKSNAFYTNFIPPLS